MTQLNDVVRPTITFTPPPIPARFMPENTDEATVVAHVRGWCHNSIACAMCKLDGAIVVLRRDRNDAYRNGRSDGWVAALDCVATGATSEQ